MLTLSVFQNFGGGTILAIVAAVAIAIYLRYLDKKYPDTPKTATEPLTEERIRSLSDEELVNAVVAAILDKTDARKPDVYALLPTLSHGQTAVYSVWLWCRELEAAPLHTLLHSKSGRFCATATDGFSLIGAAACEQALIAAVESPKTEEDLRSAIQEEQPLSLCAAYVRDNPAEFL